MTAVSYAPFTLLPAAFLPRELHTAPAVRQAEVDLADSAPCVVLRTTSDLRQRSALSTARCGDAVRLFVRLRIPGRSLRDEDRLAWVPAHVIDEEGRAVQREVERCLSGMAALAFKREADRWLGNKRELVDQLGKPGSVCLPEAALQCAQSLAAAAAADGDAGGAGAGGAGSRAADDDRIAVTITAPSTGGKYFLCLVAPGPGADAASGRDGAAAALSCVLSSLQPAAAAGGAGAGTVAGPDAAVAPSRSVVVLAKSDVWTVQAPSPAPAPSPAAAAGGSAVVIGSGVVMGSGVVIGGSGAASAPAPAAAPAADLFGPDALLDSFEMYAANGVPTPAAMETSGPVHERYLEVSYNAIQRNALQCNMTPHVALPGWCVCVCDVTLVGWRRRSCEPWVCVST
jgi:hypothetical protein